MLEKTPHHTVWGWKQTLLVWSYSTYTSPALWIPTNQLNPQPTTPPPNFPKCPQLYQGPLKGARVSASQNKESYYTFRSNSGTPPHLKVHQSFNRGFWFCKDWGFCSVTIYFEIILHPPPNGNLAKAKRKQKPLQNVDIVIPNLKSTYKKFEIRLSCTYLCVDCTCRTRKGNFLYPNLRLHSSDLQSPKLQQTSEGVLYYLAPRC